MGKNKDKKKSKDKAKKSKGEAKKSKKDKKSLPAINTDEEGLTDYVQALTKYAKQAVSSEIEQTQQVQEQPVQSVSSNQPQKQAGNSEPPLYLLPANNFDIKGYDFLFKPQQNCYLIDYENVKVGGLYGLDLLPENNVVCIFFSENQNKMTVDEIENLKKTKAKIVTFKVDVKGRNALDFQLVSYLGYLIAEHLRHGYAVSYHIVTADKGFDNVVNMWRKFNIRIDRRINVSNVAGVPKVYKSELERVVYENGFSPEMSKDVMTMISLCKTKVDLHNRIIQVYGYKYTAERCSAFYRVIKNLLPYK